MIDKDILEDMEERLSCVWAESGFDVEVPTERLLELTGRMISEMEGILAALRADDHRAAAIGLLERRLATAPVGLDDEELEAFFAVRQCDERTLARLRGADDVGAAAILCGEFESLCSRAFGAVHAECEAREGRNSPATKADFKAMLDALARAKDEVKADVHEDGEKTRGMLPEPERVPRWATLTTAAKVARKLTGANEQSTRKTLERRLAEMGSEYWRADDRKTRAFRPEDLGNAMCKALGRKSPEEFTKAILEWMDDDKGSGLAMPPGAKLERPVRLGDDKQHS